ncbi:MAG: family 1 glycosylhydrolase [Patescibacteria group bacterium]
MERDSDFPEGFLWGASSSAHQAEGYNHNDWTEWEEKTAKTRANKAGETKWPRYISDNYPSPLNEDNYISGKSADHFHRFGEDFEIAASLGHNAHRFSIEWSRIEPEEGEFSDSAISHYRGVFRSLRERGLRPVVTLWHWTLPLWVAERGGWENGKTIGWFAAYAGKIFSEFKDENALWITINEPEVWAANSYLVGKWPPQKNNLFSYLRVLKNLARAHKECCDVMRSVSRNFSVGIAKHNVYFEAAGKKVLNRILKRAADWWWNSDFLDRIEGYYDFIGLNYYFHNRIDYGFNKNENSWISDMGWEIYPDGLYHALLDLGKYRKPIYVTENGIADSRDAERGKFITEMTRSIGRAIRGGVDVRGYLYWSLTDNFEWVYGFWPRFGLVGIDYKNFERKIRPSALVYKKIIKGKL